MMKRGELRSEIMSECPSEFEGKLYDWISDLEGNINDIISRLDIRSLQDLHQIADAEEELRELRDALY